MSGVWNIIGEYWNCLGEFVMMIMALILQDSLKRKVCARCKRRITVYKRRDGITMDGHICRNKRHEGKWD